MVRNLLTSWATGLCVWCIGVLPTVIPSRALGQENSEARHHAERASELAEAGDFHQAEDEFRRAVEFAPRQPAYLAALASTLAREGNLRAATTYFEKALQLDQANVKTRRDLAATQWQLGRLRAAKANLQQVLKRAPGDRQAILLLGMVAENSKDYLSAARMLASVEEELVKHPEAVAALIHSYYELGEREKAQQALESLVHGDGNSQAIFLVSQVAAQAHDYEVAEKLLTSIRSVYPDPTAVMYQLASVQYRTHHFAESQLTLLDLINAGHVTGNIYNLLAWSYESQGHAKEAIHAFNRAIELDPAEESNHLDLVGVLLDHNEFTLAQEVARKTTESFPSSFRAYHLRAAVETRASDFSAAVSCYARAVELDPHNAEANLLLAQAQEMAGMGQAAETTLQRGMRLFPRDARHYQEYAVALLKDVQPGDAATKLRAAEFLQAAIHLDSALWESHYRLGGLRMEQGETSKALGELETAERLEPGSSKVRYALWRAYRRLGRDQEAAEQRQLFERAKADEESLVHKSSEPVKKAD